MVFPKAIAILIPTLATVYCLPFAVSISMDPQTQNFEAGHFSSLALELGGNGLQWMLFGGSLACFIGLYDAEVMQGERTMMFFCESTLDGRPTLDLLGGQTKIPSGRISTWLFEGGDRDPGDVVERHGPIVRRVYVVANAVTVHPRILRMCAQLLGTRDMRIQQSELWYVLAHPLAPPLDLTCSLGAES